MDPLQAIASATQIVASMVGAVSALEEAYRDLREAPKRIRILELFVCDLENVFKNIKQKHAHKLHNSQLERQHLSLGALIERLHVNLSKARKELSKGKPKSFGKVVWISMVGNPLSKVIQSIRDDLTWWLELQKISDDIEKAVESNAESLPPLLRVTVEQGYPMSKKCHYVRKLLEEDNSAKVILIVGLSGIGKSCLARQVASSPPIRFVHGAVELRFGQWCSRAACNGNRIEYHKRLAKRISWALMQIGFIKNSQEVMCADLEDMTCLLQTALVGKSLLILLDDVWEQDIVERFAKLYNNDCRYLVTTRNEAVFEITEAEKVEICKDDIKEISRDILLHHCLLSRDELPSTAESLLDRCGHHPLTVAVMGKALRKETRLDKWEKAIFNLSTYATWSESPISYTNEKSSESTLTIFGSFEFSLEAMPEQSRTFFLDLAAISWTEPVPEACLEALWTVLGQVTLFPLIMSKLVEGSLVIKMDTQLSYHVHDMVSLYLENKTEDAISRILMKSSADSAASIAPWLFIFGKETAKFIAKEKMESFLNAQEMQVINTLENIIQSLMASKSISELEASRKSFSVILGPRAAELISTSNGSQALIIAVSKTITTIFTKEDYCDHALSFESTVAIDRLLSLLQDCDNLQSLAIVTNCVAKIAEFGNTSTIDKVLMSVPMNQLAELFAPESEEWHESACTSLMSLTKAGKSKAVEMMMASGIDKRLLVLLKNGSEVAQHHAIVALKTFYELGGVNEQSLLPPGALNNLPWNVRLSFETFKISDRTITCSPKAKLFEDLLDRTLSKERKQVSEALQEMIPIVEKASDPMICEMILKSHLVERLASLLQNRDGEWDRARSESAFILMKLTCSGGEPFIRRILKSDIILELVRMMQYFKEDLQDSAYMALHHIIFGKGSGLFFNRLLQMGVIERLIQGLDSKLLKTKELNMLFLLDLVEAGSKPCIERMLSLGLIEKLVNMEKGGGKLGGGVVRFLRGLELCKNISAAERRVIKQHIVRKVREAVVGHKLESSLVASVEDFVSESSRGSSGSKQRK
ncbi:hypothetical protein KFK09_027660 [Dendrobium nobile]|uniref:NB-ARC domain-containing protein n=1 Tax=Dendrobium nobile TaxID=94219 RepID=A0A8T3A0Z7_DENNO|nr:hypothetical protein KFK09_027660 [Dendrobium nobile]